MACGGDQEVPETEEEIALAQIATERWNDYKQRFIPAENMAIADVMGEAQNPSDFGPGMANIATQQAFSSMEPGVVSGIQGRGRGRAGLETGLLNLNRDRIASSGLGQANAYGLQRTQNLQNLQSLINMGQGQAGSALSGLGDAASAAQQQAIMDARASAAARAAVGGAIGTAGGMWYGNQNRGRNSGPQAAPAGSSWTDNAMARGGFTDVDTAQADWAAATGNGG